MRALAGYLVDTVGRRKLLVVFVNHSNAAAAGKVQEALLEWAMPPSPD